MMVLGRNSGVSHVVSGGGARGTAPQRVTRARAGMVRGGDLKLRASFTTTTVPAASAYCYHTTGNIASTLQLYPRRAGLFEPTRIPVQAVFQYRAWERRAFSFSTSKTPAMASATSFYDFKPKDKKGSAYDLSKLNGKVVLVVNTASKCGFTPQFEGLEKLYKEVKAAHPNDFEILGFPCNQFGGQDPGSNEEIQEFCQLNYGVSFPVLGKIDVNGSTADPAFEWLKNEKPGLMGLKRVKWNFEKFLVGRDGKVKGRWASTKKPEDLKAEIEKELNNK